MSNQINWPLSPKQDKSLSSEKIVDNLDQHSQKNPDKGDKAELETKKTRQKVEKDAGSRWIAPILLLVTILISLFLKLFSRN